MSQTTDIVVPRPYARLGANHGYVIEGDVAQLHADVELLESPLPAGHWALQLWACDTPHTGGSLAGVKVAEATVTEALDAGERARRLDAEAQARVPAGQRDYAMVLVLASGNEGHYDQIHDFANYPARQRFATPHFEGSVGYHVDGDSVTIEADAISSPRASDNLSGSLRLELWALAGPYQTGTLDGHVLGYVDLGRLAGQSSRRGVSERGLFSAPPAGSWDVVLMLREWAGDAGYVTRDYARFEVPYVVADASAGIETDALRVIRPSEAAPAIARGSASGDESPVAGVDSEVGTERVAIVEDTPPAIQADVPAATPQAATAPAVAPAAAPAEAVRTGRVAINSASVHEIAAIKGISRKVATAIVNGRPYGSLDALVAVKGIGPKLLDKLRPSLTL